MLGAGSGASCANAMIPAPLLSSTTVKFSGLMPSGFILEGIGTVDEAQEQ